ncbi:MAG: hypothetical protein RR424_10490, partial [Oscillospiraceae bacterium]
MKNKTNAKRKSKILCLVIAMVLMVNMFAPSFVFASDETQGKVIAEFTSSVNDIDNTETISVKAKPLTDNITVTGIKLPDDTKISGNAATFTVNENKEYSFTVQYDEIAAPPQDEYATQGSAPDINAPQPTIKSGSETFAYTVSQLINIKPVSAAMQMAKAVNYNGILFNQETNTIVGYVPQANASTDIVIPQEINGFPVLHIA